MSFLIREFNLEVQLSSTMREAVVPRSGYVSKPRVVSTLGKGVHIVINPERVAPVERNRVAVELAIKFCNSGLKQPWALKRNRFAVPPPLGLSMRVALQT